MLSVAAMPDLVGSRRQFAESETRLDIAIQNNLKTLQKVSAGFILQMQQRLQCPIIPGLPDDVAKLCLALVPRCDWPAMSAVCKAWKSFMGSKEFLAVRKEAGMLEEWMYILTDSSEGRESHWEAWGAPGKKLMVLPPMPGTRKAGFGVAVLDARLFIVGGNFLGDDTEGVTDEVYQYDSRLNRWSLQAKLNVARRNFACAEVNGLIYAVGGFGSKGESLSSAEVYDPDKNEWSLIENLRRPRWGCFAFSFDGMLYVMGGRSTFTIGNSRLVDVYNTQLKSWRELKNGGVMVTTHAILGKRLFCMEWQNQRKLSIFDPVANAWQKVPIPVPGSSSIGFFFGTFDGKLLLFSVNEVPGCPTLLYDPDAPAGSQWQSSSFRPAGFYCCNVTIKA